MAGMSIGARCYLHLAPLIGWLPGRLAALHRAIWLGLLDSQALNEVTRFQYSSSSGFGAEGHNLAGLWPWEADTIRKYLADCPNVLVAGAGGGREAIALAQLGYNVTAFDFCETLTAACRRHIANAGITARVLDAPPDGLPDDLGVYDGMIAGRGFYHHIPGRGRRIAFLEGCRTHIVPGGPLFLSDFFTPNSRKVDPISGYFASQTLSATSAQP